MKILVTGGAGFIGSAVVRMAIGQGHQVVNLDALTYAACLKMWPLWRTALLMLSSTPTFASAPPLIAFLPSTSRML